MKKFFVIMLLAAVVTPVLGQERAAYVYRFGNSYMHDGVRMNSRAYAGFLKNNSPEAFARFNDGHKLATAGWALFGGGLFMEAVGAVMMSVRVAQIGDRVYKDSRLDLIALGLTTEEDLKAYMGDEYNPDNRYLTNPKYILSATVKECQKDKAFIAGEIIGSFGSAAVVTSIPLLVVGYVRMHDSANIYNMEKSTHTPAPYVTLNAVRGGAGLALNF